MSKDGGEFDWNDEIRKARDFWDEDREISFPSVALTYFGLFKDCGLEVASSSRSFLGLAAGSGKAERLMAQKMGMSNVVLVDRVPEPGDNPGEKYEQSDIFDFLATSTEKFGVVTLFGAEYLINNLQGWKNFWSGVDRVTTKGSFIFVTGANDRFIDPNRFFVHTSGGGFIVEKIAD